MSDERPPTRRREWLPLFAGMILLTAAAAVLLLSTVRWPLYHDPGNEFPDSAKQIADVEIELSGNDYFLGGEPFRLTLSDPKLIRSAVVDPLHHSKGHRPPVPAYIILGGLRVHYVDGTTESAVLFLPWGTWIHEERNYRKSDLSLLMNDVKRVIESTRPTAPILEDTRYWRLLDR